MSKLIAVGNRHPFLTSLMFSTCVAAVAVGAVSIEGQRRIDDVQQEERDRAVAIAAAGISVCQTATARANVTIAEIIDYMRQRTFENRPGAATPTLDELDAIRTRNLDPSFCTRSNP